MTDLTLLNSNDSFIASVLPALQPLARTMPGMLADLSFHFTEFGSMPVFLVRLYWHSSVEGLPMSAEWGRN